jgi:hypothetical protein
VSSVLLVCRLEVEVIIIFIPAHEFAPASTVDAELHFQTNRAVRPDPLGQHDLVRRACAFYGIWLPDGVWVGSGVSEVREAFCTTLAGYRGCGSLRQGIPERSIMRTASADFCA